MSTDSGARPSILDKVRQVSILSYGIELAERGLAPEAILRAAMRRLCRQRAEQTRRLSDADCGAAMRQFATQMRTVPIALVPELANAQHYEVPAEFFAAVLGPHRKYSCCFWDDSTATLADAEARALELTCERAELADGQRILELGCGWGSLSLWMAERYPAARITAVSNSAGQRRWIEAEARARNLTNLDVLTADINEFAPPQTDYDRVVSVEMFEHLRNYELLLHRIAGWLQPRGKLFVHVFCHRRLGYVFETEGAVNWMGRHFFSGGIMPSRDLLSRFDHDLQVVKQWDWNGRHYARTAEAWLENLTARRNEVLTILAACYGPNDAGRWYQRWRMFFLAVAELFGYAQGEEWYVAHDLLEKP